MRPGIAAVGIGVVATAATPLGAQMLGVPVVQSPFANRAIIAAVNGGMTDEDDEVLAGALSFKPAERGLALVLGGGWVWSGDDGFWTAGARLAYLWPLGHDARFAVAPFAGVGGTRADSSGVPGIPDGTLPPLTYSLVNAPVGVSVGWRHPIGVDRTIAVHVAPSWQVWRFTVSGAGAVKNTYTRIGIGVDVALNARLGVSLAWEGGRTAKEGEVGPAQSVWGLGVAYVVK